jgi:hypothetical protein
VVEGINPAFGYAAADVPVTITGKNFLAKPSGSGLDTTHQAWLGDTALQSVTWVDAQTLHATVPKGISAGVKDLRVRNAYDRDGVLAKAYTVLVPTGLAATVAAARKTADTNQDITVTLTVMNGAAGGASARIDTVSPSVSVSAGSASCTAVSPKLPETLTGGQSLDFTWKCKATMAGTLTLGATVAGAEVVSGKALSATAAIDTVAIQTAAALSATLTIDGITTFPATVSQGQPLVVRVTVTNSGTGAANVTAVTPTPPSADCKNQTPATPMQLGGGLGQVFDFACSPQTVGSLSLGASISGSNTNTGGALAASVTPPAQLTVQYPPQPTALITVSPTTTADVGQPIAVTFRVVAGSIAFAGLTNVTVTSSPPGLPTPPSGSVAATCTAVSPSTPVTIPPNSESVFTWSCQADTVGTVYLSGTATGTDANSGQSIGSVTPKDPSNNPAFAKVNIQTPAALQVNTFTLPKVATNQASSVKLILENTGGATARITAVTPLPTPIAGLTCGDGAPTPNPTALAPIDVAGAGSGQPTTVEFDWTCAATAGGTYSLAPTVTAADVNWSAVNPAPAIAGTLDVTGLTASLTRSPTTDLVVGESARLTLTVSNATGAASADVSGIVPSSTNTGVLSCPLVPEEPTTVAVAGGTSALFHWNCTADAIGSASLGAAVNTGTLLAPSVTALSVNVAHVPLQAALVATPTTVSTAQDVALKLTLTNPAGAGSVNVASVTPAIAGVAGTCANLSPSGAFSIAGGASQDVLWTCTPIAAGIAKLSATVSATDSGTGTGISASVTEQDVTVQLAGTLSVSVVAGTATVNRGQSVPVTATFTNNGGVAVNVTGVAGTISGGTCTGASDTAPTVPIGGAGTAVPVTWTCSTDTTGTAIPLDVNRISLAAADANGKTVTPAITAGAVKVQNPASLSGSLAPATGTANATVDITLSLQNSGDSSAAVTGATLTVTGTAVDCTGITPSGLGTLGGVGSGTSTRTLTWTGCTTGNSGDTATVSVDVTATDQTNPTAGTIGATVSDLSFSIP